MALLVLTTCSGIYVSAQAKLASDQTSSKTIAGTWRTVVTPRNCQTGDPVAPAFPGLLTFAYGGTLTGTSTVAASVFGVWDRKPGVSDYSFAFTNLRFNPTGTYIGTQAIRQDAVVSGNDSFASTGTVEIYDVNGVLIGSGCASSTGVRFQ